MTLRVQNNLTTFYWSGRGSAGFLLVRADVSHRSCVTHVVSAASEETGMEGISSGNGVEGRALFLLCLHVTVQTHFKLLF